MNHSVKHISIPQPCTQNWADMDIVEQGRYCQNCRKTVTDFTKLTSQKILEALSSSENVCGRFDDTQLKVLNATIGIEPTISRFSWKKFSLAAAFVGFLPFIKAEAKFKPLAEHRPLLFKKPVVQNVDTAKELKVITGIVTDSLKLPISGATVMIKGTHFNTVTGTDGSFRLMIPASDNLIGQIAYIGFERIEFKIDRQVNNYSFVLKVMASKMGEVVIIPAKTNPAKADKHR